MFVAQIRSMLKLPTTLLKNICTGWICITKKFPWHRKFIRRMFTWLQMIILFYRELRKSKIRTCCFVMISYKIFTFLVMIVPCWQKKIADKVSRGRNAYAVFTFFDVDIQNIRLWVTTTSRERLGVRNDTQMHLFTELFLIFKCSRNVTTLFAHSHHRWRIKTFPIASFLLPPSFLLIHTE